MITINITILKFHTKLKYSAKSKLQTGCAVLPKYISIATQLPWQTMK
jgi:uncharacterized membrane protein